MYLLQRGHWYHLQNFSMSHSRFGAFPVGEKVGYLLITVEFCWILAKPASRLRRRREERKYGEGFHAHPNQTLAG